MSGTDKAPIGSGELISIHVGRIQPLGPDRVPSGFVKCSVAGEIAVRREGLDGDEQADLVNHGGQDKAVYGYNIDHYPLWTAEYPQHRPLFVAGGVGENLAMRGFDEATLCIGDVLRVGDVLLQVSQPRQPCFKFALRFSDPLLPKAMVRNGRSGWYFRVLEAGTIAPGRPITLVRRLYPDWSIARLNRLVTTKKATPEEIAALRGMAELADDWRRGIVGLVPA